MDEFANVSERALGLEAGERALLASQLLDSLEELKDQEWDALWLREVERRRGQLRNGRAIAVPSSDVHDKIDQLLR